MKDVQGLNFFGYVKSNPLKYIDQDGLNPWVHNNKTGKFYELPSNRSLTDDEMLLVPGERYAVGEAEGEEYQKFVGHWVTFDPNKSGIDSINIVGDLEENEARSDGQVTLNLPPMPLAPVTGRAQPYIVNEDCYDCLQFRSNSPYAIFQGEIAGFGKSAGKAIADLPGGLWFGLRLTFWQKYSEATGDYLAIAKYDPDLGNQIIAMGQGLDQSSSDLKFGVANPGYMLDTADYVGGDQVGNSIGEGGFAAVSTVGGAAESTFEVRSASELATYTGTGIRWPNFGLTPESGTRATKLPPVGTDLGEGRIVGRGPGTPVNNDPDLLAPAAPADPDELVTRYRGTWDYDDEVDIMQDNVLRSHAQRAGIPPTRWNTSIFRKAFHSWFESKTPPSQYVSLSQAPRVSHRFGPIYEFEVLKKDLIPAWWNFFGEKEEFVRGGTRIYNPRRYEYKK